MTTPPDQPTGQLPPDRPPPMAADHRSALAVEDFRSLRRWVVTLGLLTLAALAVAIIALLRSNESDRQSADRRDVRVLVRALDDRLDQVEERSRRASEESDAARLDRRLRRVEDDLAASVDGAADANQGVVRLQRRLDRVARDVEAARRRSR